MPKYFLRTLNKQKKKDYNFKMPTETFKLLLVCPPPETPYKNSPTLCDKMYILDVYSENTLVLKRNA